MADKTYLQLDSACSLLFDRVFNFLLLVTRYRKRFNNGLGLAIQSHVDEVTVHVRSQQVRT